jgi:hypothetical protein
MQEPLGNKLLYGATGLETRVELDKGIRPEVPFSEALLNSLLNPGVLDPNEGLNVATVVLDKLISKVEDIHIRATPLLGRDLTRARIQAPWLASSSPSL